MNKINILPYVLRLLRNAILIDILVLIIVAIAGYFLKFTGLNMVGNFLFLAGILVLIVAGLGASGGVRQGLWSSSPFLSLQRIVTQKEYDDPNSEGVVGFFRVWGFSLSWATAALVIILLGILITTFYPA